MTRNNNDDDDDDDASSSPSKKRFNTFDEGGVATWSDVNHDMLFLVMMQLGFVIYFAFSGVCKSWRSFALSNRKLFLVSKPPMKIYIPSHASTDHSYVCLANCERKWFKTIIPRSFGKICFGLTFGYLIFFSRKTRDFWLVNPITRHELHFPNYPLYVIDLEYKIRPILVFSPSISGWVFVVPHKKISFSIAGKGGWNHMSSTIPIIDLYFFKGKIYTLHTDYSLRELRLDLKSEWKAKWKLLEFKNIPKLDLRFSSLVSSNENLYAINWISRPTKIMELDFGEMKWMLPEKTIEEYAFFVSYYSSCVAIKPSCVAIKPGSWVESWVGRWTQQYKSHCVIIDTGLSRQGVLCYGGPWYFPHDCLNVNMLDE